MGRGMFFGIVAAVAACVAADVHADESVAAIDLTTFGQAIDEAPSVPDDLPLQEVASGIGSAPRRFYLSGMIGPSFANLTSPVTPDLASEGTIFDAGAAIGMAFERQRGRLRLEVEGMGRSNYIAPFSVNPTPDDVTLLFNNWSVMQNFWRDLMFTDRFGAYGGGGIGAGGYMLRQRSVDYTYATPPGAGFAWQAGGGLLWEVNDRLTFDVGYRYFQIDAIRQEEIVFPNQFAASELMFTLRLYEPFRAWRR